MRVIPVLDLLKGRVVHAVKGEREHYQPVESVLTSSVHPLEVAGAIQEETQCQDLYIADLDAIQGIGHNRETIDVIASQLDITLWIDAGVSDADSAKRIRHYGADVVIIGSETLRDLNQLRAILNAVSMDNLIISIDIAHNRVLSDSPFLSNISPIKAINRLTQEGFGRFILLILDMVGTAKGPDLVLLEKAIQEFPDQTFIAGGGVKTPDHLKVLSRIGAYGVLIATSLHKGWITGKDISRLRPCHNC